MSIQEVSAQVKSGDRAGQVFTVNFNVPDTIEEALDRWGEPVVYSRFKSSLIIDLQSRMRSAIKGDNASPEAVQAAADNWTPDVKSPGKPFIDKIADFLKDMDPESRAQFLEEYL